MGTETSNKKFPISLTVAFLGIAGLAWFLGSKFNCNGKGSGEKDPALFPTITIRDTVEGPLRIDTVRIFNTVRPQTETVYDPDTVFVDKLVYRVDTAYMVLSFEDSTIYATYHKAFLEQSPKSPKLLRHRLGNKLQSFDLLSPDGYTRTQTYPINTNLYEYTWEDGLMKAVPLAKPIKVKHPLIIEASTGLYQDFFANRSRLELDGSISYRNFGLRVFTAFSTNTKPRLSTGVGTKITIARWQSQK